MTHSAAAAWLGSLHRFALSNLDVTALCSCYWLCSHPVIHQDLVRANRTYRWKLSNLCHCAQCWRWIGNKGRTAKAVVLWVQCSQQQLWHCVFKLQSIVWLHCNKAEALACSWSPLPWSWKLAQHWWHSWHLSQGKGCQFRLQTPTHNNHAQWMMPREPDGWDKQKCLEDNVPLLSGCLQPFLLSDHSCCQQATCSHSRLHICQFHWATVSRCWNFLDQWRHTQPAARCDVKTPQMLELSGRNAVNVSAHNNAMGAPVVAACNGSESLLSSSVPLHSNTMYLQATSGLTLLETNLTKWNLLQFAAWWPCRQALLSWFSAIPQTVMQQCGNRHCKWTSVCNPEARSLTKSTPIVEM